MTELLAATITDMVSNFLYYDRKEDEDLPVGAIDEAVRDGILSVDEIVAKFRDELTAGLREC